MHPIEMEILKRDINQRGFLAYCEHYCKKNNFIISRHQYLLIQKLEEAMIKPNSRIIIMMPPRHGKSTFSSILAPAYFLGRFPRKNVIMTTHTQEFSDRWGRQCRGLVSEPEYKYIFNTTLSKSSAAASRFELNNRSSYYGSGILGNFTGLGGHLIVGDDWYRGKEDADSELIRQKIWDAWIWDLQTRLEPGASVILPGTPWHEDDHFGRIKLSKLANDWEIIELPALIETQEQKDNDILKRDMMEALWPERFSTEKLIALRDSLNKKDLRMWNSLYQVQPTLNTGDYILSEYIQTVDNIPDYLDYYGASDYAVSHGKGDYTVHVVVGYDWKYNELYIVDVWRERTSTDVWIDKFIDLAIKYNTLDWAEEGGVIQKSLDAYIKKAMFDRRTFILRKEFSSTSDKSARAQNFRAIMAQKKVFIKNAEWTDDLIKELLSFPSGKYDDQLDALSLIGRMLNDLLNRVENPREKEEYEYESGYVIAPGLDYKVNPEKPYGYKKF